MWLYCSSILKEVLYFSQCRYLEEKPRIALLNQVHAVKQDHSVLHIQSCVQTDNGFSGGASGKEPTSQCRRGKRCRFDPWVKKILWRRAWQPTPVFFPGEFFGPRSLAGYSLQGRKEWDTTEATKHSPVITIWCFSPVVAQVPSPVRKLRSLANHAAQLKKEKKTTESLKMKI